MDGHVRNMDKRKDKRPKCIMYLYYNAYRLAYKLRSTVCWHLRITYIWDFIHLFIYLIVNISKSMRALSSSLLGKKAFPQDFGTRLQGVPNVLVRDIVRALCRTAFLRGCSTGWVVGRKLRSSNRLQSQSQHLPEYVLLTFPSLAHSSFTC